MTSFNQIGIEGATKIAEVLKENHSLTNLDLIENQIGNEGATKIAKSLKENRSLTNLDLSQNQIGIEGATKIAEVLKENHSLTNLYLRHNENIGDCRIEVSIASSICARYSRIPIIRVCNMDPVYFGFMC